MASVPAIDADYRGCFSDRHPWLYFSVLVVLVGIPRRGAISTTYRRTIVSLRNDRQISRHPKNTFAGQLVCPHCQTAFPVTWRRYWSAPWGNYRCPKCRQIYHATANYWWVSLIVFVTLILIVIVGAVLGAYVFYNAWMGAILTFIGYFVGFPLDKWIDGHLKHLKIR